MTSDAILVFLMSSKSAEYATKLKKQPVGTIIEATDPDGDRLIVCQIEEASRAETLQSLGVDFLTFDNNRPVGYLHPQSSISHVDGLPHEAA